MLDVAGDNEALVRATAPTSRSLTCAANPAAGASTSRIPNGSGRSAGASNNASRSRVRWPPRHRFPARRTVRSSRCTDPGTAAGRRPPGQRGIGPDHGVRHSQRRRGRLPRFARHRPDAATGVCWTEARRTVGGGVIDRCATRVLHMRPVALGVLVLFARVRRAGLGWTSAGAAAGPAARPHPWSADRRGVWHGCAVFNVDRPTSRLRCRCA